MSAENGQNFIKNSEFQCLSVDGASAMNLPLHGIVSDFSDISHLDSTESLLTSSHNDTISTHFFTDQCSMCHCVRIEDSDQEYPGELSKFLHWLCPTCEGVVKEECKRVRLKTCTHSIHYDSCDDASTNQHCPCINCQTERESVLIQKKEFHEIWSGVAEAIGRVFNAECAASVLSEPDFLVLKSHVARLCQMNCHYLFKKIEKRCRQMVINMKVHILKKSTLRSDCTADMAYNFMSIIIHKYTHLCTACEILADVLSPLVEQHMRQFNATWQLHNKYLFCCVIFNEPIVQKCLPEAAEIIRQDLRKKQQEKLSKEESMTKKYSKVLSDHERFAKEMADVSQFWKSCQQNIEKYDESYEIEKMKERKHCLGEGLEFIKKQRQLLKDIQGGCLLPDAFDNVKMVESFEKLWILGRADETHCPNCRVVKCSYDEAGMSHLITCGIISPDIISDQGLSPASFDKHEPDFREYLNSASVRSSSSSSDDSFQNDPLIRKERSGDGVSSEEDDDDDDDDEEEDDDDDDFQDAQQIHLPDFCPSIENASSELVNRCNQSFLLQQRDVVPDCSCLKCNKESLCLFSYNKKNPKHFLKLMLKASQNGDDDDEEDDDDDDEDYDIHEDGIHTSSDLEYAAMSPLTNTDLLLKSSFVDYPNDSSFSPKSIIETIMDCSNQSPFSQKQIAENNYGHRFLLPTLEQQCGQERNKCLRLPPNDEQVPPPASSPINCTMSGDDDVITSLEEQVNLSMNLNHCCASKMSANSTRSPAKIDHKIPKSPVQGSQKSNDVGCCEIKVQKNDSTKSASDKKCGKDRSTQHPEKAQSPGDKKAILANYYQVSIKHPNSCQKQQSKATSQQKVGGGDCGSTHPQQQQKQGSFTVPQQPAKQQPFRCQASSCNGHMVGAGDAGLDKEECDTSPHPHPTGCEGDDKFGGQKDPNGKAHCECWHCEFFGHETQSNAPTSKNFAECRDRLRQKLKKKQSSTKSSSKNTITLSHTSVAVTKSSSPDLISGLKSVDELIDYINGGKTNQPTKERCKDSGTKRKTGKNKKMKDNILKNVPEDASNDSAEDKKSIECLQHLQTSNTAISIQLETKPRDKSKGSESKSRIHTVLISGTTVTLNSYSHAHSSLENSVPILKLNNSKKFEIPANKNERGDRKNETKEHQSADKGKKDSQKNGCHQQDKLTSSPKISGSTNEFKLTSKTTLTSDLKSSLTPPSSPHLKSKKSDARKISEQNLKQRLRLESQKMAANELKEDGFFMRNKSMGCLIDLNLTSMIDVPLRSEGSNQKTPSNGCNDQQSVAFTTAKNSNRAGTSSSPVSTSKSKKQKKRNKMCSDLSFEEIFKPKDEDDLAEDDREIEEFKRFCFNTPPLPVREKLRVNLNVKDIFSRRKPSQSCNS